VNTKKKKDEKKRTEEKASKTPKAKYSLENKIDKKKVKIFVGTTLTLTSVYLLIACISYFFTWTDDQDRLLDKSLLDFLFNSDKEPVANWLGKFGAWTSHLLIYRLFGISSLGLCFLMFISGFRILFDITIVDIKRSYVITLSYMLWSSLFLGFFTSTLNYLGGTFGFYLNEWLVLTLGNFGTMLLSLVSLYVITTVVFNPNYVEIFNKLMSGKEVITEKAFNREELQRQCLQT